MHDEVFRECVRPAGLQAWVHAAHQRQAPTAGAFVRLPMPWMSLTLQLGAGGIWQDGRGAWRSFPRLALRGLFDAPSAAAEAPHERVHYALALLQAWACQPLFGLPAALLRNEVLDLETVLPDWSARLLEAAGSGEPLDALLAALARSTACCPASPNAKPSPWTTHPTTAAHFSSPAPRAANAATTPAPIHTIPPKTCAGDGARLRPRCVLVPKRSAGTRKRRSRHGWSGRICPFQRPTTWKPC